MIRKLDASDLDNEILAKLAEEFYASTEFLTGFKIEAFKASWVNMFNLGMGVIFALEDDHEIYGVLGAIKYPDFNSGALIAGECFWYVAKAKRGEGISLLEAFEQWAKDEGCKWVHMVHIADLMPEVVKRIYESRGYKLAELAYKKEVS